VDVQELATNFNVDPQAVLGKKHDSSLGGKQRKQLR
jgi:hypothetical protein